LADVKHLFISKTRKELDFAHEPEDKLHYIELAKETRAIYNELMNDKLVTIQDKVLVADTISKLRVSLHMLEGGVAKIDEEYLVLKNQEKIDYIKQTWGDSKDLVIMYNYKAELTKLTAHFKNAAILQATSFAEGVDLSSFENLVIYSQDFSTAR